MQMSIIGAVSRNGVSTLLSSNINTRVVDVFMLKIIIVDTFRNSE